MSYANNIRRGIVKGGKSWPRRTPSLSRVSEKDPSLFPTQSIHADTAIHGIHSYNDMHSFPNIPHVGSAVERN